MLDGILGLDTEVAFRIGIWSFSLTSGASERASMMVEVELMGRLKLIYVLRSCKATLRIGWVCVH